MSNDSNTTRRDELLKLHAPLTMDAQKQPEYRDNTESALYGYSEGVEHALDTVWAKGYRKLDPTDETAIGKVAATLAKSDGWLSLSHPSPRHQTLLRERARAILTVLAESEAEATR